MSFSSKTDQDEGSQYGEEGRNNRRSKRPDREVYRPPPVHGKNGRGAAGDEIASSSPNLVKEENNFERKDESSSNERRESITQTKKLPPQDARFDQQNQKMTTTSKKKSHSDVGRNDNFRKNTGGRYDDGGQGSSQGFSRDRGSTGKKNNWDRASAKDFTYERRQGSEFNNRGRGGSVRNQQSRAKYRNKTGSHENIHAAAAVDTSSINGGSERGRKMTEFVNSKPEIVPDDVPVQDWRRIAQAVLCPPKRTPVLPVDIFPINTTEPPPNYPKDSNSSSFAVSAPQPIPKPQNRTDLQPIQEVHAAIAALDSNHQTNLSWGDEMERVDREEQLATMGPSENKAAANFGSRSVVVPSGVTRPTESMNAGQRGGIIPMTAAVASALHQSENRGSKSVYLGRGRGTNSRGRFQHPGGRGRGNAMTSLGGFAESRYIGDNSNQSFRLSGPNVRGGAFPPPAGMGRGRALSTASMPPSSYGERESSAESMVPTKLAREIDNLENDITEFARLIGAGQYRNIKADVDRMLTYRKRLQDLFAEVIFINPRNEEQRALEHRMWKSAFYQPIEALRSVVQSNVRGGESGFCQKTLLSLIEEGLRFYDELISAHETNYAFKLEQHCYPTDDKLMHTLALPPLVPSTVKYSLACCQRFLVSLGDLARYREQVKHTSQFGVARNYYNKAAQLAPTNGRAHNQLALLAMYTSRWLDAVFYYVRSLAAKHAFLTARESLVSLFDDIRKKVDYYEAVRTRELDEMRKERRSKDGRRSGRRGNQREIWKFPDGTTSLVKLENDEQQGIDELALLTKVSAQELHKRCCAYLLRTAGILFTKIGVEQFETLAELALVQFRALLNLDESPLSSSQLVQLTVIFLFLIHHTSTGETERGSIKAIQNHSILLSFSIFGLLLERLERLLQKETITESVSKDMHLLLPSVRIFCVWMTAQDSYNLYSGLQSSGGGLETENFRVSMWNNLAKVCTIIESFKNQGKLKIDDTLDNTKDSVSAILPEDLYTTAFFDIFASKPSACKLSDELPTDLAAEHVRLNWLLELASVLDGFESDALTFVDGKYVASSRAESPGAGRVRTAASDDEDEPSRVKNADDSGSDMELTGEMSKWHDLQKASEVKQSLLEYEGQCRAEIIVEPHRLVVDTNSFIDHRGLIEKVILAKQYKLAVPFVVYNELLGLEKSDDGWVSQQAKMSLKMLNEFTKGTMSSYSKYVEAVTSTGATLTDFDFHRNEEAERLSNDDLILRCCRNLAVTKGEEFGTKHEIKNLRCEPITMYRKVVLLTDDKNLGLKAQGDEIPVIGIRKFVKKARLGSR